MAFLTEKEVAALGLAPIGAISHPLESIDFDTWLDRKTHELVSFSKENSVPTTDVISLNKKGEELSYDEENQDSVVPLCLIQEKLNKYNIYLYSSTYAVGIYHKDNVTVYCRFVLNPKRNFFWASILYSSCGQEFEVHRNNITKTLESIKQDFMSEYKINLDAKISFLTMQHGNLYLLEKKMSWLPLIKENYSEKTHSSYQELKELVDDDTDGNLAIVYGPPGTGKTRLIQSLCAEASQDTSVNRKFVFLPAEIAGKVSGYEFTSLLDRHSVDQLVILIIEDADKLLAPRETSENTGIVSTLLNMTDGIMGDAFNIKVIATINPPVGVEVSEVLDRAVLREGRLAVKMSIDELTPTEANAWYAHNKLDLVAHKPQTLATLYAQKSKALKMKAEKIDD